MHDSMEDQASVWATLIAASAAFELPACRLWPGGAAAWVRHGLHVGTWCVASLRSQTPRPRPVPRCCFELVPGPATSSASFTATTAQRAALPTPASSVHGPRPWPSDPPRMPQRRLVGASASSWAMPLATSRSEEHTSELQSPVHLVCRLLLEKKKYGIRGSDLLYGIYHGAGR